MAFVVSADGVAVEGAELIGFAREQLAPYRCPASVVFVPALPRNPIGKILKRELRGAGAGRRLRLGELGRTIPVEARPAGRGGVRPSYQVRGREHAPALGKHLVTYYTACGK